MSWSILTVAVAAEDDIVLARQRARRIAELLGFDRQDQTRIATAVSEIARNAFLYGTGGRAAFSVEDAGGQALVIRISDKGPGIADLAEVLSGAYVSPTGMGLGVIGARRLMDRFEVQSGPQGASVVLAKRLPGRRRLSGKEIGALADALETERAGDPNSELREANQALLASLEELRLRQEELAQLNAELESTNRGVVALYAELDQTAERLRAASEAKSRFLSHVSHEFRTPLNSIRALTGLLLDHVDGPLNAEQERQVGYIRRSAESLTELVNDLLDLAKVEAGKIELQVRPFEVADLFASLRGLMKPLQAGSGAELSFVEAADLPTLYGDEGKVGQILRNLISNALKFTDQGEVRVSAARDGEAHVRLAVQDTGIGIAPADQERIFQEFEQVAGPMQARTKGTGLGLPLSRRLAELLGGSLTVESRPGRGSLFTLRLPVDLRPPATAARKVLVVDDEEAFRYALRQMIGAGHDVIEAADGLEALERLARWRPDVVFLDLNMPGLDGYGVLSKVAGDADARGVKVIVSTSLAFDGERDPRLERADYVLTKDQLSRESVAMLLADGAS